MAKSTLKEKIGYGFGDMSSSMFWKIFSYYLPFFYSNIFGLSLIDAGVLVLVTRIWDAVSDPMMGIISDRTQTPICYGWPRSSAFAVSCCLLHPTLTMPVSSSGPMSPISS